MQHVTRRRHRPTPTRPAAPPRTRTERRARAARWLTGLSWGYLAFAAFAGLALWTLADRFWPVTLLLFGPRWILLLPLLVLIPAAAVVRPRLLVPLAAGAVIVLIPVMGFRVGWRSWSGARAPGGTLRIVTLNTGGSEALAPEMAFRVRDWGADVVALQECATMLADAIRRIPGWHHHVAGQLCLLSRHPIRDARVTAFDDLASARESGLGGSSQAVEYVIDAPGQPLPLVNLHLETPRKGLEGVLKLDFRRIAGNTTLRAAESRRTRQWLRGPDSDLIIVGDFNMPVESAIYRRDWSRFRNAFSEAGIGFGATRDNGWIQVRIDHVVMGNEWRATKAVVGPVLGLDHRPVIVDLRRNADGERRNSAGST